MRIATLLLVLTAACSPYSPDLGTAPFLCGSTSPRCPDGYTCNMSSDAGVGQAVCVKNGATAPDGPGPNSMCADDSQIETSNGANNDTIATAYVTPVATSRASIDFAGLSICPAGDVDFYEVQLTKTQNIDVIMTYESWGGVLQGNIQTSGGAQVAVLSPQTASVRTMHGNVQNLPAGAYYVEIMGPSGAGETRNNYTLTITVSPYP